MRRTHPASNAPAFPPWPSAGVPDARPPPACRAPPCRSAGGDAAGAGRTDHLRSVSQPVRPRLPRRVPAAPGRRSEPLSGVDARERSRPDRPGPAGSGGESRRHVRAGPERTHAGRHGEGYDGALARAGSPGAYRRMSRISSPWPRGTASWTNTFSPIASPFRPILTECTWSAIRSICNFRSSPDKSGAAYTVWVGFHARPAEMAQQAPAR